MITLDECEFLMFHFVTIHSAVYLLIVSDVLRQGFRSGKAGFSLPLWKAERIMKRTFLLHEIPLLPINSKLFSSILITLGTFNAVKYTTGTLFISSALLSLTLSIAKNVHILAHFCSIQHFHSFVFYIWVSAFMQCSV